MRLAIYDLTGRMSRLVWEGPLEAGIHELNFNGADMASGVYYARLEAGKYAATQKLMLLR